MNVRLIALTTPSKELQEDSGIWTAEDLIVYAARVSNPANQLNKETAPRLIAYCIRNGHWSIFETASMTVEIETSRAIAAQICGTGPSRSKSLANATLSRRDLRPWNFAGSIRRTARHPARPSRTIVSRRLSGTSLRPLTRLTRRSSTRVPARRPLGWCCRYARKPGFI